MQTLRRVLPLVLYVSACGDGVSPDAIEIEPAASAYAELVHSNYASALADAETLAEALDQMVAAPSEESLALARQAWLTARESYGPTEAYRFYDGPIDVEPGGPEGQLNAWPMDENFVDYVEGDALAGIVNDPTQEISVAALTSINGASDAEENVATGYHAIEFLLWGQDLSWEGPGARPHTDYSIEDGTASNQDRRALYLTTTAEILVDDLGQLVDAWAPEASNYRAEFLAEAPEEIARRILLGVGVLSGAELGGERVEVAMLSGVQEDEHSCFSDNTHRDIYLNQLGIAQVLESGVLNLVAARDADLAGELGSLAQSLLDEIDMIEAPFDQAILVHNDRLIKIVEDLRTQAELIERAAATMGIALNL